MPFDTLMRQISDMHGPTTYKNGLGGAAVNVKRIGGQTREYYYTIYNFSAYGSRNTPAPREHDTSYSRIRTSTNFGPSIQVDVRRGQTGYLCRERTLPGNLLVPIKDTMGRSVIQVSNRALFLLFDIELCIDAEAKLKEIYETFVAPIDRHRTAPAILAFTRRAEETNLADVERRVRTPEPRSYYEARAADRPGRTPPARDTTGSRSSVMEPIPSELEGKGTEWNMMTVNLSSIPENSNIQAAVSTLKMARVRGLDTRITQTRAQMEATQKLQQQALQKLRDVTIVLHNNEDEYMGLLAIKQNRAKDENDADIQALTEVISSHYEKVWGNENCLWGLTKPIVMQHRCEVGETPDQYRVLAGKFVVKVQADSIAYYREDLRVAMGGVSQKTISPHCYANSYEGTTICWGVYRDLIYNCLSNGDLAQMFLLVARHLMSVTPTDRYLELREYARRLRLPSTEDPSVDLLVDYKREKEEKRKKAEQEEASRPRSLPVVPATTPRIVDGGELSAEEMNEYLTPSAVRVAEVAQEDPFPDGGAHEVERDRNLDNEMGRERVPRHSIDEPEALVSNSAVRPLGRSNRLETVQEIWERNAGQTHTRIVDAPQVVGIPHMEDLGVEMFTGSDGQEIFVEGEEATAQEMPEQLSRPFRSVQTPFRRVELGSDVVIHEDHLDAELEDSVS